MRPGRCALGEGILSPAASVRYRLVPEENKADGESFTPGRGEASHACRLPGVFACQLSDLRAAIRCELVLTSKNWVVAI
ncbi:hypothetical protein Cflav_PD5151 [Pedosphaera parvula Ellin514]|uniref:Uncharacterized protein n=1 Tax=Pedosphaera parvula (strain Ellin514) TaxID=320771 RepID=B9XC48_PEDPL|nr:hypothetical protein Cflav_PD5151 [Pedosphaera parvula Ellin514]